MKKEIIRSLTYDWDSSDLESTQSSMEFVIKETKSQIEYDLLEIKFYLLYRFAFNNFYEVETWNTFIYP